jgi:hypothetical protein
VKNRNLPVSFPAIPDADDLDPIAVVVESDAIVAETEPEFYWLDVLEAFHIAFFGCQDASLLFEMGSALWVVLA